MRRESPPSRHGASNRHRNLTPLTASNVDPHVMRFPSAVQRLRKYLPGSIFSADRGQTARRMTALRRHPNVPASAPARWCADTQSRAPAGCQGRTCRASQACRRRSASPGLRETIRVPASAVERRPCTPVAGSAHSHAWKQQPPAYHCVCAACTCTLRSHRCFAVYYEFLAIFPGKMIS